MKTIASFDQYTLGFHDSSDRPIHFTRRAARAVLFNAADQVAVMHFATTGSYKLPGGGIDEGEATIDALHREVREKAGYTIANVRELGVIEEDRYFCGMHQTSYCFAATVDAFVGTELTDEEAAKGMELRWVDSVDDAIKAIESRTHVDEDGQAIGLAMMKLRETTILRSAKSTGA